jgi:hypothetical protein
MFIAEVKPFELPLLNTMEVINECFIIMAAYHLFLFTEFVPDPIIQYKFGWSIILVTIINIVINMGVMIGTSIRRIKLSCQLLKLKLESMELIKTKDISIIIIK